MCCRSIFRRSWGCQPRAVSNISLRIWKAPIRKRWVRWCRGWSPQPIRTRGFRASSRPTARTRLLSFSISIARRRRRSGITLSDVFTTLQTTLGGYFINNFNLFGRTWQVNLQAEAADRRDVSALWNIFIRNAKGDDGAATVDRDGAHGYRAASHHAVQQLPLGDHQRQPGTGRGLGHGFGRHGRGVGQDAAAWLRIRMDRHGLPGASARADRP